MAKIRDLLHNFIKQLSEKWQTFTKFSKATFGILLVLLATVLTFSFAKTGTNPAPEYKAPIVSSNLANSTSEPTGQTTIQPSIGAALEPDTISEQVQKGTPQVSLVAPKTGIDASQSITYYNSELNFSATLPPQTNVWESDNEIIFTYNLNQSKTLVSYNYDSQATTDLIIQQLNNSPGISQINKTNFLGYPSVQFTSDKYGPSIAILKERKIIYLFGNKNLLRNLEI